MFKKTRFYLGIFWVSLFVMLIGTLVIAQSEDDATLILGPSGAVLREAPENYAEMVTRVASGQLSILGISPDGTYYLVEVEGQQGWMSQFYGRVEGDLTSVPVVDPEAMADAPILNVGFLGAVLREAPSDDAQMVVGITNAQIPILGISFDEQFYRVRYEGQQGWVSISDGKVEGDLTSVPVVEPEAMADAPIVVIGSLGADLRQAPTSDAERITRIASVSLPIIEISPDKKFYLVEVEGQQGWIRVFAGQVEGDLSSISIVEAPDTPTVSDQITVIKGRILTIATLRQEPTTLSSVLGSLSGGTSVIILDTLQGELISLRGIETDIWHQVKVQTPSDVVEGYVWSGLIEAELPLPVAEPDADGIFQVDDGNVALLVSAIQAANDEEAYPGSNIINLAPKSTYMLTSIADNVNGSIGMPAIASEITIIGNDSIITRNITQSTPNFRIFYVTPIGNLLLENMTISNGFSIDEETSFGGGVLNAGSLTITNSTFSSNFANTAGGAISNYGTASISNTAFEDNVSFFGGAIANSAESVLDVTDSEISQNSANHGGGLDNRGTLTIDDSTIFDNTAETSGGGFENRGTVDITNSTFSGNSSSNGGAIMSWLDSTITVTNGTISDNSVDGGGGGVVTAGTMTLTDSTISGNTSVMVGAGLINDGTLDIQNTLFSENTTSGGGRDSVGGGLFNRGDLIIDNSIFQDNEANVGGAFATFGDVTMTNTTLSRNITEYAGGLAVFGDGTIDINNSLIVDNTASFSGAGIINHNIATLTNSTLSGNRARAGGTIENSGRLTLNSTTLMDNTAPSIDNTVNGFIRVHGSIIAGERSGCKTRDSNGIMAWGSNLVTDSSCADLDSDLQLVDLSDLNLASLADNGGPTQTHALQSGSVALNALLDCVTIDRDPLMTDQMGEARPETGSCDLGSYQASTRTDTPVIAETPAPLPERRGQGTHALLFGVDRCPASFQYGVSVQLSIASGWSNRQDALDASETDYSAIYIDGEEKLVTRRGPERGNPVYMTDFFWSTPRPGTYEIVGVEQNVVRTCTIVIRG